MLNIFEYSYNFFQFLYSDWICKLDFLEGGFEILRFEKFCYSVQPVFMKSILCAIYGSICKLAKQNFGKKDFECNYCKATP